MTNLRSRLPLVALLFCVFTLVGCGGQKGASVTGQVLNNGQPYAFRDKEEMTIQLVPAEAGSSLPACGGKVENQTGKVTFTGPEKNQGVPPGKYKVAVTSIIYGDSKDLFGLALSRENTPLTVEITKDSKQSFKIDLGARTVTKE